MRILSIKINNYKSFLDKNNTLRFDSEDVLALIGKNESGKSNTLMALKGLSFFNKNFSTDIFKDCNRLYQNPVSISLKFEFTNEDFNNFDFSNNQSIITFEKHNNNYYINFEGCLSEIIGNDSELKELINEILKFNPKVYNDKNYEIFKNKLKKYNSTFINLDSGFSILNMSNSQNSIYTLFKEKMEYYYEAFRNTLPKIVYFSNDMILKNKYTYDDIKNNKDIYGLKVLLESIDFDLSDLVSWLTVSDGAAKQKYSVQFKNKLDKFNNDFQEYYKTNAISLMHNVDSGTIEFSVVDDIKLDGTSITNFSERSDGLKWFLSLFMKIYSAKKTNKYCLILLDEPGNSLHVIAQKELLKFLMKTDNYQLIYTTHSPYMIDIEHLENIRLIRREKYTTITNGINNEKALGKTSYKETITPIADAIGLSLNYNFGPSSEKYNLVVEGITDYFYISGMIDYFKICDEKVPNIIPCIGVTNESNIVSILYGWGYKYKCLFDNDKDGNKVYKEIEKSIGNDNLYFVSKKKNSTIESLLSENVKKKIEVGSKTLNAKMFINQLNDSKEFLDGKTINNFKELFITIGIID